MLQESATWDPRNLIVEPSTSIKLYILFLILVCIVTSAKLGRVWLAAPLFGLARQAGNPAYLRLLETLSASLKLWIGFTFLGWGIFTSISVYDVCNRLLDDKVIGSFMIVFVIQEFSTVLSMALFVVLFVFLVRWHVVKRLEHLSRKHD